MNKNISSMIAGAAALVLAAPASAQQLEGDAKSRLGQWARSLAPPGTFWLDNMDDREVVRYTTPRDVRLCLPEPAPISNVDKVIPLRVTWDGANTAMLYPGNCLYFDARRVSVKAAGDLPRGTVLRGSVETERALQS